jgi:hypothetical protein
MTSEKTRARIARTLAGAAARGSVDPDALYDNRDVEDRVRGRVVMRTDDGQEVDVTQKGDDSGLTHPDELNEQELAWLTAHAEPLRLSLLRKDHSDD